MSHRHWHGGSQVRITVLFRSGAIPNNEPRQHTWPTNTASIAGPASAPSAGVEFVKARWGLIRIIHKKGIKD